MSRSLFLTASVLLLSSCGSQVDAGKAVVASEKGLDLPDVSKVAGPKAKVNPGVIRTRSIAGTWTGAAPARSFKVSFGNDGSVSVEQYVDRGGSEALVNAASGKYAWRQDGIVSGTLSGASGDLSPFSQFRVSFSSASRATVHGNAMSMEISQPSAGRIIR